MWGECRSARRRGGSSSSQAGSRVKSERPSTLSAQFSGESARLRNKRSFATVEGAPSLARGKSAEWLINQYTLDLVCQYWSGLNLSRCTRAGPHHFPTAQAQDNTTSRSASFQLHNGQICRFEGQTEGCAAPALARAVRQLRIALERFRRGRRFVLVVRVRQGQLRLARAREEDCCAACAECGNSVRQFAILTSTNLANLVLCASLGSTARPRGSRRSRRSLVRALLTGTMSRRMRSSSCSPSGSRQECVPLVLHFRRCKRADDDVRAQLKAKHLEGVEITLPEGSLVDPVQPVAHFSHKKSEYEVRLSGASSGKRRRDEDGEGVAATSELQSLVPLLPRKSHGNKLYQGESA